MENKIFKISEMNNIFNENKNSQEFIVDFFPLNYNDLIFKERKLFENLIFFEKNIYAKNIFLVFLVTNKSLILLNSALEVVERYEIDIEGNEILKSDFSFFEEDGNLLLYNNDYKIHSINIDLDIVLFSLKLGVIESYDKKGEKIEVKII